jgi:hypothetical protein
MFNFPVSFLLTIMTYTSKESSEQVELEFLSKSIGYCMKNERFGPDLNQGPK